MLIFFPPPMPNIPQTPQRRFSSINFLHAYVYLSKQHTPTITTRLKRKSICSGFLKNFIFFKFC